MQIYHSILEWQIARRALELTQTLGFVPTMGNLHIGHASLIERSKHENDRTLVSVFINPTQFNNTNDFQHYPRTIEADLILLEKLGVDYCLLPTAAEIYADDNTFRIEENAISLCMEGIQRPGHFTGMLTVVMKLLHLADSHRAYFGEKDYQQCQLVKKMVTAFFMNVDIVLCPTIRELSGLPYSSRNNRLTPEQRLLADKFAAVFCDTTNSIEAMIKQLEILNIDVEYMEDHENRRFVAVKIGEIRLIDNRMLA